MISLHLSAKLPDILAVMATGLAAGFAGASSTMIAGVTVENQIIAASFAGSAMATLLRIFKPKDREPGKLLAQIGLSFMAWIMGGVFALFMGESFAGAPVVGPFMTVVGGHLIAGLVGYGLMGFLVSMDWSKIGNGIVSLILKMGSKSDD